AEPRPRPQAACPAPLRRRRGRTWCPSPRSGVTRRVDQEAYVEVTGWALPGCTDGLTETVPPNAVTPLFAFSTGGCSGAAGFFMCAVTYKDDRPVAATASSVAPVLSTKD